MNRFYQTFKRHIKKPSVFYSNCKELPLKIFFAVAESGNLSLLITEGNVDDDLLNETWEAILTEFGELDNSRVISDNFYKSKQITINAAKFIEINGMLLYLSECEYKKEYIDRLGVLGYKVDEASYMTDIETNKKRVNQIITRIKIIQAEINKFKNKNNKSKNTFDSALAEITAKLNIWPPENITVARYLELKKLIPKGKSNASN